MAEAKTETTTTSPSKPAQPAAAAQGEQSEQIGRPVVFRDPDTGEQLDTVTALHGDEGEDPYEAGFRGVKPADEPATIENVTKQQQ